MNIRKLIKYLIYFLAVVMCMISALTVYLGKIVFPRGAEVLHSYAEDDMFEILNSSLSEVIDKYGATYDTLVDISYSENGTVNSVSIDYYAINKIKSEVSAIISEKLNHVDGREVAVPVGAFSNNMFLVGKGPKLKFHLVQRGFVQVDFENKFENAGVNQVMHTLKIKLNADIALVLPFYDTHTCMETSAILAQVIINGDTPQRYVDMTKEEMTYD